jgi:hypothetical protein
VAADGLDGWRNNDVIPKAPVADIYTQFEASETNSAGAYVIFRSYPLPCAFIGQCQNYVISVPKSLEKDVFLKGRGVYARPPADNDAWIRTAFWSPDGSPIHTPNPSDTPDAAFEMPATSLVITLGMRMPVLPW